MQCFQRDMNFTHRKWFLYPNRCTNLVTPSHTVVMKCSVPCHSLLISSAPTAYYQSKILAAFYKGYSDILSFSLEQHPGTVSYPVSGCMLKLFDFRRLILCLIFLLHYVPFFFFFLFWRIKYECGKRLGIGKDQFFLPL